MILILNILLLVVGLVVMIKGADWFLEETEKLALLLGVPLFVIGVLITGFGTSLPELITALFGVRAGALEVPVANTVGSNIANIFLILGLTTAITGQIKLSQKLAKFEVPFFIASTILFILFSLNQSISKTEGLVLFSLFIGYLILAITSGQKIKNWFRKKEIKEVIKDETFVKNEKISWFDLLKLILGILGLLLGSKLTIDSALLIASGFNIEASLIFITMVAVGTSLPELTVSIKAGLNKRGDIILGNIFGSNIFNALMVVGLPAIFTPLGIDDTTHQTGIIFMTIASIMFIILIKTKKIERWHGFVLVTLFILFLMQVIQ